MLLPLLLLFRALRPAVRTNVIALIISWGVARSSGVKTERRPDVDP